jgi:hypothetical protein
LTQLLQIEQLWIDACLPTGTLYNINPCASKPPDATGRTHSERTKIKTRKKLTDYFADEKNRADRSRACKGRPSHKWTEKQKEGLKGRVPWNKGKVFGSHIVLERTMSRL